MNKKMIVGGVIAVAVAVAVGVGGYFFLRGNANPYKGLDFKEYVELGKYEGLDYTLEPVTVTDEEVQKSITDILERNATMSDVKEGTVAEGDTINIAYKGLIDGKEFKGGTSDSQDITIGTTPMIEGFTEGLVGHKIGEEVTLNLKFPKDYQSKDVAGKDVVFKVTINSKKIKNVPELTDAEVAKISDGKAKTVAEFQEQVKEQLIKSKEEGEKQNVKQQLWSQVVSSSKIKSYPKAAMKEADKKAKQWEEQYKKQSTASGMEWKTYLKDVMKTDEKGFEEIRDNYAKEIVKNDLILYAVAENAKLSVTDKEYNEKINEIMKNSGYDEKTFKKAFGVSIEKYAEENGWRRGILFDKVLNMIFEKGHNKAGESK